MSFEHLRVLKDGWLDGEGAAPPKEFLDSLELHRDKLPSAYSYPTPEGGVQLEWDLGDWTLELEVLPNFQAEFMALNLKTQECRECVLDFTIEDGWRKLSGLIDPAQY